MNELYVYGKKLYSIDIERHFSRNVSKKFKYMVIDIVREHHRVAVSCDVFITRDEKNMLITNSTGYYLDFLPMQHLCGPLDYIGYKGTMNRSFMFGDNDKRKDRKVYVYLFNDGSVCPKEYHRFLYITQRKMIIENIKNPKRVI